MKYPFALTALLLSLPLGAAWISRVGQTHSARTANAAAGQHHHPLTTLQSLMTPPAESSSSSSSSPSGRSREEINAELASGKLMEGGKVMDFSSVKGLSRAEQALADARQQTPTAATAAIAAEHVVSKDAILGINQDVINLVGHELATFATPREVQECAAYLRYKAPQALFNDQNDGAVQTFYSVEQKERFQALLARAYAESGEVTSAFAKTFYMGTMLLPPAAQKAIWAVYVWCRRTDEIVDAPRENDQDMLVDLGEWERRLENLWKNGDAQDVYDLCLLDCLVEYPNMDITPFMDMIRGMLMDVPGLGQDRYDSFDELHLYCYRVAGTVGLMSLPIFGCATGYTDEIAREPALSLGVAFQLTNILRDVGEDAVQRGRVYLPLNDLERFGVTEDQIFQQHVDEKYVELMKFEIARAKDYYKMARRGVFMLAPESRLPVQSSLDAYGRILDKIQANGYDNLTKRAYVDKWEKLSIIPFSWYRTLDISRDFPLPGDQKVTGL